MTGIRKGLKLKVIVCLVNSITLCYSLTLWGWRIYHNSIQNIKKRYETILVYKLFITMLSYFYTV